MIQVAVLSGKGGTGKTVVSGALADILPGEKVFADCDVEAANLALLLSPCEKRRIPFFGLKKARIKGDSCVSCGLCAHTCRFRAVRVGIDGTFPIDPIRCEGCGVCVSVCPERAIVLRDNQDGEIILSDTELGPLVYAELMPGSENSGLLVHEVKKEARKEVRAHNLILIDGPPGIGCPVISTLSGINTAVIVTEPGVAAFHDLQRLITVSRGFSLSLCAVINRVDLHEGYARAIEKFCEKEGIPLLGKIPFDPAVQLAVRNGKQRKWARFKREYSMSLWQGDWKQVTIDGQVKWLIAFMDDSSGLITCHGIFDSPTTENTLLVLRMGFAQYGIPREILTDHGTQFVSARDRDNASHTFKEFPDSYGVKHIVARIKHPQTNGKIERFFGEVERRLPRFGSIDKIVVWHNEVKPHSSLNYDEPYHAFLYRLPPERILGYVKEWFYV